jgi:hypothetical protein
VSKGVGARLRTTPDPLLYRGGGLKALIFLPLLFRGGGRGVVET